METPNRRYDIDWLRVIAIGLLLIYHITIAFQPWGVFIKFIQSNESIEGLWIPMSMLNVWRIPLLFCVSGMGVAFAIRKRNWMELITERSRRILLPFLFGVFTMVPLHVLLWQKYYSQELEYAPQPGHLWFLANIFLYVLFLSPLFFYFKRNPEGKIAEILRKIYRHPAGLMIMVLVFVLETVLMNPETHELYAFNLHGFILGSLAFLFGFTFVVSGQDFWDNVLNWRWMYLALALGLYLLRLFLFDLESPNALKAVESNFWIFAVFGFAYKYLNRPGKILQYLNQGAYPIYILHMFFLYLGSYLVFPLDIPAGAKFGLVVLITGIGCFGFYEFLIRRTRFLRPLFGLK